MAQRSGIVLDPRKTPVQARSAASVEAILESTIQVLVQVGKERLTTTRVARRAGVSVGTLYQYFPNKNALLQAALKGHLNEVTEAIERVCAEHRGNSLREMATALITAFLAAKTKNPRASVALYAVSADVDGAKIAQEMTERTHGTIAEMLISAREPLTVDARLIADVLQGAMVGVGRRLLETGEPEKQLHALRGELIVLACAYLNVCAGVRA